MCVQRTETGSGHQPSANGTTIKARSTKTVLVKCWETPTESDSRNFTKHTREVTGKGESLEENTHMLCKAYKQGQPDKVSSLIEGGHLQRQTDFTVD